MLALAFALLAGSVVAGLPAGVEEIVFAVRQPGKDNHWYANFGYFALDPERKAYGEGGRLCRLNLRTGALLSLVEDPRGGIRDPQVHYDGRTILFSYRRGGTSSYLLHEIQADGTGLRQITDGPWDDIEPAYLPDGGIVFCSSRCTRWVDCWPTQVAILYRCDRDGRGIRPISSNTTHDNTPWVLPDGRILYTRWEYVDRSEVSYHHLWVANPDGTSQMVFYGNMHPGTAMLDAKPIPDTRRVVASFSPEHGRREHDGRITIVDPGAGPDSLRFARTVNPEPVFRDPFPLSEESFLVARGHEILVMDGRGEVEVLFALSEEDRRAGLECHEPRPLAPRTREPIVPEAVDLSQDTGRLVVLDVYHGRRMAGVRRGEIKKLLVLEILPKPVNFTGSGDPVSLNGTFTLERILGTVPVESDGSAHLEVPALRSLFFVALDEDGMAVKRMQSFLTVQPGETVSCAGCHEERTQAPRPRATPIAAHRPPSPIEPIAGIPDVFDFPRDIQPILDRHCVRCHDWGDRQGGVVLSGDRGPMFSHAYYMLIVRGQVSDGRNLPRSNYPPRGIGSSASPLMEMIAGTHHEVALDASERARIRLWIESAAPFAGTYAALGTGMIGAYFEDKPDRSDTGWPATRAAAEVLRGRCGSCHTGRLRLPDSPSDDMGMPPWMTQLGDARIRFSRHIVYNLSRPERSLLLFAPLAREAGGYGICGENDPVFADARDPGYEILIAAIREAKEKLEAMGRFDAPGFRPGGPYVRELVRYGILSFGSASRPPVDVYAIDRRYWESLWHRPVAAGDSP